MAKTRKGHKKSHKKVHKRRTHKAGKKKELKGRGMRRVPVKKSGASGPIVLEPPPVVMKAPPKVAKRSAAMNVGKKLLQAGLLAAAGYGAYRQKGNAARLARQLAPTRRIPLGGVETYETIEI